RRDAGLGGTAVRELDVDDQRRPRLPPARPRQVDDIDRTDLAPHEQRVAVFASSDRDGGPGRAAHRALLGYRRGEVETIGALEVAIDLLDRQHVNVESSTGARQERDV